MHTSPTMSLHYLVKHKYQKTNNIIQSLVVTSSVMGQFKEIPSKFHPFWATLCMCVLSYAVCSVHAVCRHNKHYSSCTASLLCFPCHCSLYWLLVMLYTISRFQK